MLGCRRCRHRKCGANRGTDCAGLNSRGFTATSHSISQFNALRSKATASFHSSLFSGNDNSREERRSKREKRKEQKEQQPSDENCRSFGWRLRKSRTAFRAANKKAPHNKHDAWMPRLAAGGDRGTRTLDLTDVNRAL